MVHGVNWVLTVACLRAFRRLLREGLPTPEPPIFGWVVCLWRLVYWVTLSEVTPDILVAPLALAMSAKLNGMHAQSGWVRADGHGVPARPPRIVSAEPLVLEYSSGRGKYPLWRDPSYWYQGAVVRFDARNQFAALAAHARLYVKLLFVDSSIWLAWPAGCSYCVGLPAGGGVWLAAQAPNCGSGCGRSPCSCRTPASTSKADSWADI